jgi:hypothetical protein
MLSSDIETPEDPCALIEGAELATPISTENGCWRLQRLRHCGK